VPTVREDRFGLPLSTVSQAARDAYVAGVDSVISGVAGYREHLARALEDDPCFGLAHVALARGLLLAGEAPVARACLQRAREHVAHATPREQSHVNVLGLGLEGQPVVAMDAMLVHLRSWPRDAMVLAPATSVFGLFGFSGDPGHEEKLYQLLASLAPAYGEDWWFETRRAGGAGAPHRALAGGARACAARVPHGGRRLCRRAHAAGLRRRR
jgi:hypothetical protein